VLEGDPGANLDELEQVTLALSRLHSIVTATPMETYQVQLRRDMKLGALEILDPHPPAGLTWGDHGVRDPFLDTAEIDFEPFINAWTLQREMAVPTVAEAAVLLSKEQREGPIGAPRRGDPLDGQVLLTRLKVAALLALLDGRAVAISEADWADSGVVMAVSDATRRAIIRARSTHERREADKRAVRSGRSAALAADAEADTRIPRAMAVIRSGLVRHGGEHTANAIQKLCGSRYARPLVAEALGRLVASGEVIDLGERESGRARTASGPTSTGWRCSHDQPTNQPGRRRGGWARQR
jgi:hypothetical protein